MLRPRRWIFQGDDYLSIYEIFASGYGFPEFTEAEKRKIAILYCSGVVGIGESAQSSSTLDPTFWSLHPTMERLLRWERQNYPEAVRRAIYKWTSDNVVLLGVAGVSGHQRRPQYFDDDHSLLLIFELVLSARSAILYYPAHP